ncbi:MULTISPECIES: methyl-accepting chemotaxis protein [Pseudomonas]|uniref:Methyl-accepting chemotaxis protein n=1 Tax=Pseudomonas sessilinigenes TaxID=658629 RepID=A0ABX8MVP6_9PSED|nr:MULTISPECIES: methyl-accepting chemotaxis protein [Pseudomonas]AZC24137.1 Methyl-accepting chemotaxis protein I (serine chemoreceptor protein) [Pseudomonas sessilinigenes]QIH08677.1 methyl-accepting chemotaxis protein [Pseudomonas sp. BIOMIG1BAC]QXH43097.1 methyl-accepting chemotaxis protein [Pseudomonas sessilinigenes]UMZ14386.1 methyl-accepting chemotaxis protein [Pseudomonas sp. MPFS]
MVTRNLKLTSRALLSFGAICVLLIGLGGLALWKMGQIHDAALDLQTNWMPSVRQAAKIESGTLRVRLEALHYATEGDNQKPASLDKLGTLKTTLAQAIKDYEPLVSGPEEKAAYEQVKRGAQDYLDKLAVMINSTQTNTAQQTADYINQITVPLANTLQASIEELIRINESGAGQSAVIAGDQFSTGLTVTWVIIILAIVLTILIATLFTRSVTRPVLSLLASTRKIAEGDLRTQVEVSGHDELTDLQAATQAMLDSLKSTIRHISDSSTQLASAAEEMSAITRESNAGIQQQSMETDQAATAVNEMTAAVEEVARNAVSASQSTQASERSAGLGKERVEQTIHAIEKLTGTVENTRVEMAGLAQQAQDITKVLDVIRAIAEQTNLLALNAAIEAARAGEQGRGFAVVADEVRALAHRTQLSTQEIEQMIQGIQNGSSKAMLSMQQSSEDANQTLAIAHEAGSAIGHITEAISDINERNLMIATASEEQAQVARSVDQNLMSIRDLALQSSSAASQTSLASSELSSLAVGLNKLVARFAL